MYKLLKEKGTNKNVTLVNTETNASLIIGKLSIEILDILKEDGHSFGSEKDDTRLVDAWALDISDDVAKTLSHIALRMKKPIRNKVDITQEDEQVKDLFKKPNKDIDAMDVLLGLANYN